VKVGAVRERRSGRRHSCRDGVVQAGVVSRATSALLSSAANAQQALRRVSLPIGVAVAIAASLQRRAYLLTHRDGRSRARNTEVAARQY
jgi:hypothetical protein